jgi:hypothetical protein
MRFFVRGVGCDAPGFYLASLMLMTEPSVSILLTMVKPWSTWVITVKTSSRITKDPLNKVNTHLWSTLGQNPVKNPMSLNSRTFATFSKIHLNTSKYPNIKVVLFFEGHNFSFGWHFKFWVKKGEKLGQPQLLLFISAMKTSDFACSSCSNGWSKHLSAFVKVVEGSWIYNFAIYLLVHFSLKFGRETRSTQAKPNWIDACRAATSWPRSRALWSGLATTGPCTAPLVTYPLPRRAPSRAGRTAPPLPRRSVRVLLATHACQGRPPYPHY